MLSYVTSYFFAVHAEHKVNILGCIHTAVALTGFNNKLCVVLECRLTDIAEFVPDEPVEPSSD